MQFVVLFTLRLRTVNLTLLTVALLLVLSCHCAENFHKQKYVYNGNAVTSNCGECASIGMDILKNHNGTAIDAAIAVSFCEGVVLAHGTGLGGGFVATIYDKKSGKVETIGARERAPIASTFDMFINMKKIDGVRSIGVPGALKGYAEMHKKYGRTPWKYLIEPSIKLCRTGFKLSRTVDFYLRFNYVIPHILESPPLREVFVDPQTGKIKTIGDVVKREKFAETLEIVAKEGAETMYSANGTIAKLILKEFDELGGILTMEDFTSYDVSWKKPVTTKLRGGYTLNTITLPGSGLILALILNILNGYEQSMSVDYLHKMAESFKYAYAKRSNIGDENSNEKFFNEFTDMNYADRIRELITKNNKTFNDFKHYGANYASTEDHGTAHISVLSKNGDAVSITSSINDAFGSKICSKSTGIIFNNQMDDFATPGITNLYGMAPSPAHFIKSRKCPMSSMCPSIVIDKKGDAVFIVGAAGGSKIPTTMAYVFARHVWMKESLKEAVSVKRIHHQLMPMELLIEHGYDKDLANELKKFGHIIVEHNPAASYTSMTAISRISGHIETVFDPRRTGSIEIDAEPSQGCVIQ